MDWPNEMFLKGLVVGLVCLPLIFVACEYVSRRLSRMDALSRNCPRSLASVTNSLHVLKSVACNL